MASLHGCLWSGRGRARWGQAVARVTAAGGAATDDLLVLSASVRQFGQYRGQTFRWLLENAVGYACSIVGSCEAKALAALPVGRGIPRDVGGGSLLQEGMYYCISTAF